MIKWPTDALGKVADVIRGVTFEKSEVSESALSGYTPILRAGNIGEILNTANDLVWVPAHKVAPVQLMRPGDIAICMSSGSAQVVGKSALLEAEWRGSVGAFCAIIRFNGIRPRFGAHWLRGPGFKSWRDSQAKGANIQNLRKTELERLELPIPPPAEQERIVRILDEADGLRRLRSHADEGTASLSAALFLDLFGHPASNPKAWATLPFEDCFTDETARAPKLQTKDYQDAGPVPIVDQGQKPIAGYTHDLASRCPSDKPFIVFGDHTRIVKFVDFECAIGADGAKIFTARPGFDPAFLSVHLRLAPIPELGYSRHMREVRRLRFMKPPMDAQRIFAQHIAEIRDLQAAQSFSRQHLDDLFQSLLHRAFQEEL